MVGGALVGAESAGVDSADEVEALGASFFRPLLAMVTGVERKKRETTDTNQTVGPENDQ